MKLTNYLGEMAFKNSGNAWTGWHGTDVELYYRLWKHKKDGGDIKVVVPENFSSDELKNEIGSMLKTEYRTPRIVFDYRYSKDGGHMWPDGKARGNFTEGEILKFKGQDSHSFSQGSDSGVGTSHSITLERDGKPFTVSIEFASAFLELVDFQDWKPTYMKIKTCNYTGYTSITVNDKPSEDGSFNFYSHMGLVDQDKDYNSIINPRFEEHINNLFLQYGIKKGFTKEDIKEIYNRLEWKPQQYRNVISAELPWFKTFMLDWSGK